MVYYNSTSLTGAWASEVNQYSYNGNSCSGVCLHYTQMIWNDTGRVGCGTAKCPSLKILGGLAGQIWVCRYLHPGNYVGQLPYVAGRRLSTDDNNSTEIVTSSTMANTADDDASHKLAG
eukprot:19400-Heterococcus_DN1.PRE.4